MSGQNNENYAPRATIQPAVKTPTMGSSARLTMGSSAPLADEVQWPFWLYHLGRHPYACAFLLLSLVLFGVVPMWAVISADFVAVGVALRYRHVQTKRREAVAALEAERLAETPNRTLIGEMEHEIYGRYLTVPAPAFATTRIGPQPLVPPPGPLEGPEFQAWVTAQVEGTVPVVRDCIFSGSATPTDRRSAPVKVAPLYSVHAPSAGVGHVTVSWPGYQGPVDVR